VQHVWVQQRICSLFFPNMKGMVHHEFVPPNTTVNSDFYCDILRCKQFWENAKISAKERTSYWKLNAKISAKERASYWKLKQHEPWFDKWCSKL
jgi:hypothetical protein